MTENRIFEGRHFSAIATRVKIFLEFFLKLSNYFYIKRNRLQGSDLKNSQNCRIRTTLLFNPPTQTMLLAKLNRLFLKGPKSQKRTSFTSRSR